MNNFIFYHVTAINDYLPRFEKTFRKIVNSDLINYTNTIFISLNGKPEQANQFIIHPKIKIINLSENHPNEALTSNFIKNFSYLVDNANILYLHSKGVTRFGDPRINNINAWIDYMEYFLINNWYKCVYLLDKYNTVGVELQTPPQFKHYHYGGNFWWSKSSYIKDLKYCDTNDYYSSENWLLSKGMLDTYANLYSAKINLYEQQIDFNSYKDKA